VPPVLKFDHPDPARAAKEDAVRDLPEQAFRDLFAQTRKAAAQARYEGDMAQLYQLVRGLKTLQRIGGERGIIIAARPLSK
jgi:hypothetical protein